MANISRVGLSSSDQSDAEIRLNRWKTSSGYFAALAIYLSSRAAIYIAIQFSINYVPLNPAGGGHFWDAGASWYHRLLRWDSGWYLRIVDHGYSYDGNDAVQQPVNFSPLFPIVTRLVSLALGLNSPEAMLVVSGAASIAAVLLFYRLVKKECGNDVALIAVALLSFCPTSFFLSAGYAESLMLLLMVASLLLLKRERLFWAAAVAGLAVAARPTGIILLPALLWGVWQKHRRDYIRLFTATATVTLLSTSGLWLFSIYQWLAFGYPFGSFTNRAAFLRRPLENNLLFALMLKPFQIFDPGLKPQQAEPLFFLVGLLFVVVACRRVSFLLTLVGLGALLMPYFTYASFYGMPRFALLALPAFIGAALLCEGRTWLTVILLGISTALLCMYTALFSQWYWVA